MLEKHTRRTHKCASFAPHLARSTPVFKQRRVAGWRKIPRIVHLSSRFAHLGPFAATKSLGVNRLQKVPREDSSFKIRPPNSPVRLQDPTTVHDDLPMRFAAATAAARTAGLLSSRDNFLSSFCDSADAAPSSPIASTEFSRVCSSELERPRFKARTIRAAVVVSSPAIRAKAHAAANDSNDWSTSIFRIRRRVASLAAGPISRSAYNALSRTALSSLPRPSTNVAVAGAAAGPIAASVRNI